ncbi:hypothetical protein EKO27_g7374 [Xylaria grammica]|uniref:Uncharacterized protein n=1 Tax=Xylaria grammica TaxID=363999 RepID=A0A439CZU7_9PEZI|nr:hypothetical protein EKO27_g7374 [Xylaria grammica]
MVRRFLPDRSPRRYGMRRRDHDEPDDEFYGINIIDCGGSDFYEPISDIASPRPSSPLALGQRQKEEDEEQATTDRRGSTSRHDMPAASRPRRECTPSTYPPMAQGRIVQVGEGTTVAGQSSDDFARKSRISLCYQCCTHRVLQQPENSARLREERTTLLIIEAKLPFMKVRHPHGPTLHLLFNPYPRFLSSNPPHSRRIRPLPTHPSSPSPTYSRAYVNAPHTQMPPHAAKACEDFRTFLIWWMEKVDCGADASIERRARDRVQEMRDEIPGDSPISGIHF